MKTIIEKLIKEQIAQELDYIKEHEQIKSILKPLEGKEISGSVLNKHRLSVFENDGSYYKFVPQYGMFYIMGKYDHLIGYQNSKESVIYCDNVPDISRGFCYFDACSGSAAQERIKQLENINIDLLVTIFSQIKESFEKICVLFGDAERKHLGSYYNPIYYQILRAIKPDSEQHSDVKLSNFYFIRK